MTLDGYYLVPITITLEDGKPVAKYDPLGNGSEPQLKIDLEDNPDSTYDQIQYQITIDPNTNLKAIQWAFSVEADEGDISKYVKLYNIDGSGKLTPVTGVVTSGEFDATDVFEKKLNFALSRKGPSTSGLVFTLTNKFLSLSLSQQGESDMTTVTGGATNIPPGGIIRN
ncbi:hypothetical protein [Ferrimonas balearica]|uniref:hypothetical protein n=1 Tax=Ferrimonas balearica TaxID=44012 RepID=UPI001C998B93|nr:hypothetical protein [Ferrimonas balearica]MBY5920494.1 hypothetical protein [Ferrimonas balearica]MBY5996821.1 hypothetical protein [Ferrimonas balearica]